MCYIVRTGARVNGVLSDEKKAGFLWVSLSERWSRKHRRTPFRRNPVTLWESSYGVEKEITPPRKCWYY